MSRRAQIMSNTPRPWRGTPWRRALALTIGAGLLLAFLGAELVGAPPPPCPPATLLPPVPAKAPRPLTGPESVASFVDSLSRNDAAFEVIVGQGRILTVKEDLTRGKAPALIAVGDPSVVDFVPINARQVRLIG